MTDPAAKVTRAGQTLSARMWDYLEAAYAAAGLDPDEYLVVTQGAYKNGAGASASGSTHDGAGAADLRVWNLPSSARANMCERLIVELRKRGGCAWYRDQAHGGMDPHIHVVLRGEAPLSSGAAWQVGEYDKGRNGLSNGGPDYHPRPAWQLYTMGEDDTPAGDDEGIDTMPTLYKNGASKFRAVFGDRLIGIPESLATKLSKTYGLPILGITDDELRALEALSSEK